MTKDKLRLYYDLAWLWPLWQDPTAYGPWCEHVTELVRRYSLFPAKSLLNMGCGGGKNAFNLKRTFDVTGIDISQPMLEHAGALNAECRFLQADMRSCDLGMEFDSVVIDDAVASMLDLNELGSLFATALKHLRAGGVMVVTPEYTRETFNQDTTRISTLDPRLKPENLEVTFIENEYDPDPTDDTYEYTLVYLIRQNGKLRVETDQNLSGLFTLDQWRETLAATGFQVYEEQYDGADRRDDSPTFVCVRPA